VTSFAAQGTPIEVLQIGNEINGCVPARFQLTRPDRSLFFLNASGFLWPVGQIANNAGWNNTSQLLHSAREGARAAGFSGKVGSMESLEAHRSSRCRTVYRS
jgi:arabinogalactan endo-1,4-beta-galactosidase